MATTTTHKPLDNLTYDIVSILHEKSQALEAYDNYLADAQSHPDVSALLESIRRRDAEDVSRLRAELRRLLAKEEQIEAESSGSVGEEDEI
jgi:hypothetical protein